MAPPRHNVAQRCHKARHSHEPEVSTQWWILPWWSHGSPTAARPSPQLGPDLDRGVTQGRLPVREQHRRLGGRGGGCREERQLARHQVATGGGCELGRPGSNLAFHPHPHPADAPQHETFYPGSGEPWMPAAGGSSLGEPGLWQPQELGPSRLSFPSLSQAVGYLLTKASSPTTWSLAGLAWRWRGGKVQMKEEVGTTRSALGRTEGPTSSVREPPAMHSQEARSTPEGD